ncbi:MAG: dTDP-glucose 4,6-dehydratase [Chlamydiia bacterium]|nr:dTDP-glucose 4,6-dehydratase [Chlamydiia bacterium]
MSQVCNWRNATILLTGGAGFMGSHMIRHLLGQDRFFGKVVNLDKLTYAGFLENTDDFADDPRYEFVEGDVCDQALVKQLFSEHQFDLVIHFAAETHVTRSIDDPFTFLQTNIIGTGVLLEAVKNQGECHFHLISTDEVYGDLEGEGVFHEESRYLPSSPYSASKAASDHLTLAYARTYGVSVTISHANNNFGPNQHEEKLIPLMIGRLERGEILPIHGSGEQVREWLYVDDHSRAICMILDKGEKSGVYNIGGYNALCTLDVVSRLIHFYAKETGKDPAPYFEKITHVADRPGGDFRYALSPNKMRALGWEPLVNFEAGLEITTKWYLSKHVQKQEDHLCHTR